MGRTFGGNKKIRGTMRQYGQLMNWLVLAVGWFVITGCSASQAAPTVVPTLALPTPIPTSSPNPTVAYPTPTPFATNFPTWRSVTLQAGQSFDFRQEKMGFPTEGDLYYSAFNARQGSACFWANNVNQKGGRDLGSWSLTTLTERPLPRDRYSGQCLPVIRGHVYVYAMQGDARLAVFRVTATDQDSITFDFILRE